MEAYLKEALWNEFGASLEMLGKAIAACPEQLWTASLWVDPEIGTKISEFWYVAYHCLFWLDLYLEGSVEGFAPPAPFDLNELDPRGLLPERVFSPAELGEYLANSRLKCQRNIESATNAELKRVLRFPWRKDGLSYAELLLDNMRHVQEHGSQLRMFLGQQQGYAPRWLTRADP